MNHWNYRVIEVHDKKTKEDKFEIREVYYDKKRKVKGFTANAIAAFGHTKLELLRDLQAQIRSVFAPVLKLTNKRVSQKRPPIGKKDKISDAYYFEVMDRSYSILQFADVLLGDHPAIENNDELRKVYDNAIDSLGILYQTAGRAYFEKS